MDLEVMRELAHRHLAERKAHREREKGFIYYHGQRVAQIAVQLREHLMPGDTAKDEVMIVGSFFHDVAKGIEPHGQYGAVLARELLQPYCNSAELEQVTEVIRCHQLRRDGTAYPDYIKIVQDADILDHFGIIEIWMNFQYNAYMDNSVMEAVRFYDSEFTDHAQEIKSLLNYEVSHRIYDEKIRFIETFHQRMKVEAEGGIYSYGEECQDVFKD